MRDVVMRIYWDGSDTPAAEAPLLVISSVMVLVKDVMSLLYQS